MQACVDWVLIIFGTQVIKKKRPVRPVFPDYLFVFMTMVNTKTRLTQKLSFGFANLNMSNYTPLCDKGSFWEDLIA